MADGGWEETLYDGPLAFLDTSLNPILGKKWGRRIGSFVGRTPKNPCLQSSSIFGGKYHWTMGLFFIPPWQPIGTLGWPCGLQTEVFSTPFLKDPKNVQPPGRCGALIV